MPYEIIEETAKVYRVRFRKAEGETPRCEYCEATVRPFPGGGSLSIQSSYGTYAYTWCATGPGPFVGFLLDLDFDYFMGKARPGYREFDHEKTVAAIRQMIRESRRQGDLDKSEARECWDDLDLYGGDWTKSADYFLSEVLRSKPLCKLMGGDYGDICRESPNPNTRGFWDELWPVLCARWREEISPPANAAAA